MGRRLGGRDEDEADWFCWRCCREPRRALGPLGGAFPDIVVEV